MRIYVVGYMKDVPEINAFSLNGVSSAVISCGVLILLMAIFGCCGAHSESKVFLFPYATLVRIHYMYVFI